MTVDTLSAPAGVSPPYLGRRMDLLLIIRGLAALSVVAWHAEGYKATFPSVLNTPGRTAVWLFFGISGYVIAYGFIHRRYRLRPSDLRDFYTNRFLRIYPLFISLSVLTWVTEWLSTGTNPMRLDDVPAQILAFQFNQNYILNGVFWTLGIEIHFYLLAPLLVLPLLIEHRFQPLIALAMYVGMVYWSEYAATHLGWSWDGRNVLSNVPHFFAGMMACRLVSGGRFKSWPASLSIVPACALLGYSSWLYHRAPGTFWSMSGLVLVDAAIVLFVLAHARLAEKRSREYPIQTTFAFLGTLSYGIYAWHAYFMKYIPWTAERLFALVVLSICAAYASYRLIERPALQLKRHPLPRMRAGEVESAIVAF